MGNPRGVKRDFSELEQRRFEGLKLLRQGFNQSEVARRVKRWQGGTMILRWTAAGVLEAERSFRKVAGYRALPKLVAALRARDLEIERERRVDNGSKAA